MKKSLISVLGLAVALALTLPVIGATSAEASQMNREHHHRHHHHHHHHIHHIHHNVKG